SNSRSVHELTALARNGDRVLAALNRAERSALGRNYLRFRIARPAVIEVAAPASAVPFWLDDQGFARTPVKFEANGSEWRLYRKSFEPGWVGLGVNGLDRSPEAHFAVFVRGVDGQPVLPAEIRGDRWDVVSATDGVSLAHDVMIALDALPGELRGSTLL